MVQNIITSFGTIQEADLSYSFVPLQSDDELVSVPLDENQEFYFKISNQNGTWDWQIWLDTLDADCEGTFYIDGALFDTADKSGYETIDSVQVLAGGFVHDGTPVADDRNYLGMLAPSNLNYMRIRWSGTSTTANATIKLVASMS